MLRGLALCALLAPLVVGQVVNVGQTYNIIGSGTTSYASLSAGIGALVSFVYRSVDTTSLATYWPTSSANGANSGIAQTSDYGIINAYLTIAQGNPIYGLPTLWTLMATLTAEVISYSFPEIPDCGSAFDTGAKACGKIQMDRAIYTKMWLGLITQWNDPAFQTLVNASNGQTIANNLPAQRVRYCYRSDGFGPSVTFLGVLTQVAGYTTPSIKWQDCNGTVYSGTMAAATTVATSTAISTKPTWGLVTCQCPQSQYITVNGVQNTGSQCNFTLPCQVGSGILSQICNSPYATGQVPWPWLYQNRMQYFSWANRYGTNNILPTSATCTAAANYGATSTDVLSAKLQSYLGTITLATAPAGGLLGTYDAKDPQAWPFTEFHMMTIQQILHTDCFRALAVAQFLVWSIQSPIAATAMAISGSGAVPASVMPFSLNTIASLTCGFTGQFNVFDTLFVAEQTQIGFAIAFAAVTWLIGLVVIYKRNHPAVVRSGPWALLIVSVLSGLNYFTVFLWVGFPTQPICQARPWVSAASFMMIFGFILYQFQDRIFVPIDVAQLLEESATDDAQMQEARAAKAQQEQDHAREMAGAQSSGASSTSSDQMDEAQKAFRANLARVVIIVFLVICNWIVPLVWMTTTPQSAMYRSCQGNYEEAFRMIMIFYNVALIAVAAFAGLYKGDQAQETSNPIHVFVLITALFIPLQFNYTTGDLNAIPNRSFEATILSAGVGIIIATSVSFLMIVMPPLYKAFTQSREEAMLLFAIEHDTKKYRKSRRTTNSNNGGAAPTPAVVKVQE